MEMWYFFFGEEEEEREEEEVQLGLQFVLCGDAWRPRRDSRASRRADSKNSIYSEGLLDSL